MFDWPNKTTEWQVFSIYFLFPQVMQKHQLGEVGNEITAQANFLRNISTKNY